MERSQMFYDQDFEKLRDLHLRTGVLFTDERFPANINSIDPSLKSQYNIEWKRPMERCMKPHLIVDGTSLFDIMQSTLGDCWVLSAMGSITFKPALMEYIIPRGQGYSKQYAGIFHFRLWHLGNWYDIVIDDLLPFQNGNYLSVRPSCANEFWPCLLEKAYAKLLGSYKCLHWGDPCDAFMNLSGGLTMTFDLSSTKAHTYWDMISMASRDTLMGCISDKQDYPGNRRGSGLNNNNPIFVDNAPEELHTNQVTKSGQTVPTDNWGKTVVSDKLPENPLMEQGLVDRHAYSITSYAKVPFRDGHVKLIRIWNPWGYGEWNKDWNDRSPLWKELQEEDRLKLLKIKEDGQFWMCWEDFIKEFSRLIICSHVPDFFDFGDQHTKWYRHKFRGQWTKQHISWNNLDTDFLNKNPLYSITVTESDYVESGVNAVISLLQSTTNRHMAGDWLPIGFVLFELPDSKDKPQNAFLTLEKIPSIKSYKKLIVTEKLSLAPGRYGVIPYTTQNEHESSFLLRVFLKSKDYTNDIDYQQNLQGVDNAKHENIFRHYATQGSKLYTWDLKRLLNDMVSKEYPHLYEAKFTIHGSREILTSVDNSMKGRLNVETFVPLWKTITQYKDLFSQVDVNRNGLLSLMEFYEITYQAGFKVHKDLLYQLFARYSDAERKLRFVDYLICMVRLKGIIETFYTLSTDGKGAYVHYEKWIQLMM